MDAFAERVDDRFEQTVELIKSHFRTVDQKVDRTRDELSEKIDGVRDDLSEKIDRVRNEMNEKIDRIESKIDQLRR
jgi:gas vesicle protein